ncbi:LysR family transcriptional regulator [Salinisphaera orenii MK-B5]|uniref:LysR family transcriptional regulator n=1 Tax=Salinisphaera orenii MK-B5 TaxID=856730 RepID=A0A423PF92_9GAMM|nr:LysR substrate-binding domain-containing protein [Salinisphaera orenii]ROO24203.1 LysR family transcriptional regulator [Salinisphaera orenii MK-B5]
MRPPVLDLRALQSLVAILDTASFTRAAEQLNYSQSAISMQIKRLEAELGTRLIERGSVLRPTRQGRQALGHAREMLRLNSELRQRVAESEVAGRVRLGMPADFAFYLPDTLTVFAERYPQVETEVRTELSDALVRSVAAGEIDLAIVTRQAHSPGGTRLRREPLKWVGAPGSAAHRQEPLPLALYPENTCEFRQAATRRLDAIGRAWRPAYVSQAFAALHSPVSAGLAVTVATPSMLGAHLEILDEDATGLPPLPEVDIAMHRRPGRLGYAARQLADLLVERLRTTGEPGASVTP